MQSAVFDTNILIDYLKGRHEAQATIESYGSKPSISVVTWMEVMVGAKHHAQEQQTRHFLSQFDVLQIDSAVSEKAVEARRQYGIKLPDAIILATTQVNSKTLVTRNTKDFQNVPGVIVPYSLS